MRRAFAASVALLTTTLILAERNNPVVTLRYTPTEIIADSRPTPDPAMTMRSARLAVVDGRLAADRRVIGDRTDDGDRKIDLTTKSDLSEYLAEVLQELAKEWGIKIEEESETVFTIRVMSFTVRERNQAMGATYSAIVTLGANYGPAAGEPIWTGKAGGDASRFGKKFSSDNINEAQSDALKEAFGNLVDDAGLQAAWSGKPAPTNAGASTIETAGGAAAKVPVLVPEKMLLELKAMLAAGLELQTVAEFVRQRRLEPPLTGADIVAWKQEGVPEELIRIVISQN